MQLGVAEAGVVVREGRGDDPFNVFLDDPVAPGTGVEHLASA